MDLKIFPPILVESDQTNILHTKYIKWKHNEQCMSTHSHFISQTAEQIFIKCGIG